jgi:hypothetical protein
LKAAKRAKLRVDGAAQFLLWAVRRHEAT